MKLRGLLLGCLVFISVLATAENEVDPFIPKGVVPAGPYKGIPVQPNRRPIHVLTPEETLRYGVDPNEYQLLGNINHDIDSDGQPEFVIAKVKKGTVEEVIMQTSSSTVLGHTQLRFKFKEPIQLLKQPGHQDPKESVIQDIIYSVDAALPEGVKNPGLEGIVDSHYPRVHRFSSLYEDFYYRVMSRKRTVKQYPINLDEEKKQQIWNEVLDRSERAQYSDMLGMCRGNCTTESFELLDKISPATFPKRLLAGAIPTIPYKQDAFLNMRGLAKQDENGKVIELPTVNAEFEELKKNQALRDRFKAELAAAKRAKEAAKNGETVVDANPIEIPLRYRLKSTLCGPIIKRAISKMSSKKSG